MKKILAFLLTLSMVPTSFVVANAAVSGDANHDGMLDASDVAQTLQATLQNDYIYIADVDDNGILDSKDAAIILQKVLDSSYTMPVPDEREDRDSDDPLSGVSSVVVDGKEVLGDTVSASDVLNDDLSLKLSNTDIFENGESSAYLVSVTNNGNEETKLVGDTTLKNWVGNWENWQNYIYPDDATAAEYPLLDSVWDTSYDAYIAAFYAYGQEMGDQVKAMYPDTASLKNYWNNMTYTTTDENPSGVNTIKVEAKDTGYALSWVAADGTVLATDSYTMTGKMANGLEGAEMYIFTADTLADGSAFKYFVTMCPGMEGTEDKPIAAHYHFQYGSSIDNLLNNSQLYNGADSNIKNKYWYATMINSDDSKVAKYNVILGMHRAEKMSVNEENMLYGTMDIPYADFYANEGVDYDVDAVSSATTSKWSQNTGLVNGTYSEANENGGGTILGVKYPVAISSADLAALGENNYNFTETSEIPSAYKLVTVTDGVASFSSVSGESAAVEGASADIANSSNYGDFQITVNGLSWADNKTEVGVVYGVLLKTNDGKYYALRHLENIWRGTNLAFSTGFVTSTHGNNLVYDKFVEIMGKTIDQIVYITDSGYHTIDTNLYVGKKYNATLTVNSAELTSGYVSYTVEGLPTDFDAEYTVDGLDAAIADGTITLGANAKVGGYTLTITDKNGVYVPLTAKFEVTTNDMPVKFDETAKAITANDGVNAEDFVNFIANISSVTVAGTDGSSRSYGSTSKIVNDDGTINFDATYTMRGQTANVFASAGTYTLTVQASGYTQTLTFDVTKA